MIAGGIRRIWVSQDAGLTWGSPTLLPELNTTDGGQFDAYYVNDVEFIPGNDSIIVATAAGGRDFGTIWRTTDLGATWQNVTPQIEEVFHAFAVEINPFDTTGQQLYALSGRKVENTTTTRLFISDNAGATWVQQSLASTLTDFAYWMHEFKASKVVPGMIYVGAVYMRVIRQNSGTWQVYLKHDGLHADMRDIKLYSVSSEVERVLIGTDGGIMTATVSSGFDPATDAINWQSLNGLNLQITQIYAAGKWEGTDRTIYGTQDNGTWLKDGETFTRKIGGDGAYTSVSQKHKNWGTGGVNNGGQIAVISKQNTLNQGISFINSFIPSGQRGKLTTRHYFGLTNPSHLYMGVQKLYRLTYTQPNTLSTWTEIPCPNDSNRTVSAFAELRGKMLIGRAHVYYQGILSASTVLTTPDLQQVLQRSLDGGTSFHDISHLLSVPIPGDSVNRKFPVSGFGISCIKADPFIPGHFILGFNGFEEDETEPVRVLETFDNGDTWSNISVGLPPYPIVDLVIQNGAKVYWAATDGGVFRYDGHSGVWECFNNGLPPTIVTSLSIDHCSGRLTIGTYGRGLWECDMPSVAKELDLTQNVTIDTEEYYSLANNIHVPSGITMMVKGELHFAAGYGIKVSPGGKLVVDGGTITGACDTIWRGIEVHGIPNAPQTASIQGMVELKNGARIEHAEIAVCAGLHGSGKLGNGGGIVRCTASFLYNNVKDFVFHPYTGGVIFPGGLNTSYIRNSELVTDEQLPGNLSPKVHIEMHRTYGINISGNRISNDDWENYDPQYRGMGILSNTATYQVVPACIPGITPGSCTGYIWNEFTNLYLGIEAYSYSLAYPFFVQEAWFENNVGGIAMSGVYGASVTRSEFRVPGNISLPNPDASAFGIHLFGCAGFEIEENDLVVNPTGTELTSGIAIRESVGSNRIYNNSVERFTVAVNVMGKNAGEDFSEGLQILCNELGKQTAPNIYCIALTDFEMDYNDGEPTMAATQGMMPIDLDDVTAPAGNTFSYNSDPSAYDYFAEPDANSVIYFSHSETQNYNVVPLTIEGDLNVQLPNYNVEFDPGNSCPSEVNYTISKPYIISKILSLDSLIADEWDVYMERVDNGSTTDLIDFIRDPDNTSIQVRNELMLSPTEISNQVWSEAINRNPAMNPWHLAQALIAGSPLNKQVITMMENAGIDQYYIDLVEENQPGGVTQKMIMESEIAYFNLQRQHTYAHLARAFFAGDSTIVSAEVLSHLEKGDPGLRVPLEADVRIATGDFETAENLLGSCIISGTNDNWCELQLSLLEIERDSLSWDSLPQGMLDIGLYLSASPQEKGCAQARAFMMAVADSLYDAEIAYPQSTKSLKTRSKSTLTRRLIQVFPNPASNEANVVLSPLVAEIIDRIEVSDSQGRIVETIRQPRNPIWIVNVGRHAVGHYHIRAFSGDKYIDSAILHIVR